MVDASLLCYPGSGLAVRAQLGRAQGGSLRMRLNGISPGNHTLTSFVVDGNQMVVSFNKDQTFSVSPSASSSTLSSSSTMSLPQSNPFRPSLYGGTPPDRSPSTEACLKALRRMHHHPHHPRHRQRRQPTRQ